HRMEEQIEQAVAIALSPSSDHTLKSQSSFEALFLWVDVEN
ncbi:24640_t:CDS:2, partial [Racocetra persica]